jgi:hypothetical protein
MGKVKHGWGKRRLGMAIYGNFACDEYEIRSQLDIHYCYDLIV